MKRKDILRTGLAGILGISLFMGGASYAYLQSSTEKVENKFQAYIVNVDLAETTGSDYAIVPGTSARKDPTVTVAAGLPVYVFVEVEDTTNNLVSYAIDENWIPLEGFSNVYYRESDGKQTYNYSVLTGNQVSYSDQITNDSLQAAAGLANSGLNLTFQAHAIQKGPFTTPANAYMAIQGIDMENAIVVNSSEQLQELLTHVSKNNLSIFLKNGEYDLANGSHINGNNLTVVGESKDGVVINVGTSEACHRGQASILVDANNAVFKNLTLTNTSKSEKSIIKSFENHNITLDNVKVLNNGNQTAINVHNGVAVIKDCYISHPTLHAVAAVTATQSKVTVTNTHVETKWPATPQFGFNYAVGQPNSYNDTTEAELKLTNVTGSCTSTRQKWVTILSERDGSLGTNLDKVYWNNELITEENPGDFKITTALKKKLYTINL